MQAMLLERAGGALCPHEIEAPAMGDHDVLLRVASCGVCRTDLHIVDGELAEPKLPLVLGHQVVGEIIATGARVDPQLCGRRVGVPWLGGTCGACHYCRRGLENLCERALFTGYTRDGGFAELAAADHRYCFALPEGFDDQQAAPLLCAGLIGYRSLRMCGDAETLAIYGFGAAAHIVCQVAVHQGRRVGAFTRPGDEAGQSFARRLGVAWALGSDAPAPEPVDAAIIFAPVGALVVHALRSVRKGGRVVCGGIHMSAIPSFPYELLWGERSIHSVANLTRADGREFLAIAAEIPVRTQVTAYPLARANDALGDLRRGKLEGAAVLTC